MANRLSIFNSNKFPYSLIILIFTFLVLEGLTRLVFRPQFIKESIYTKYSPKYDYGFDNNEPLFYKQDNKLILYPTPYLSFWKQELPAAR